MWSSGSGKRLVAVLTVSSLAVAAAACGSNSNGSSSGSSASAAPGKSAKGLTVVEVNGGLSFPFQASIDQGVKDQAKKLGVKVVTLDSQGKTDTESNNVQDALTQKPDGILLQAVDGGTAQAEVNRIKASNIPVIAVHTQVGKNRAFKDVYPGLNAFVTQDEQAAGQQAGRLAAQAFPNGAKTAIVEGSTCCFEAIRDRTAGFQQAVASGPKFTIVSKQPGAWTADGAQSACRNMLQSNPSIQLFYAQSDDMGAGCVKAVRAAKSQAQVIGIGGSKVGLQQIKKGGMYGTVCFQPYEMGQKALQAMVDQLTGKSKLNRAFLPYTTPPITKASVASCQAQW
jgi:ribose transport system substrate-binding protein